MIRYALTIDGINHRNLSEVVRLAERFEGNSTFTVDPVAPTWLIETAARKLDAIRAYLFSVRYVNHDKGQIQKTIAEIIDRSGEL